MAFNKIEDFGRTIIVPDENLPDSRLLKKYAKGTVIFTNGKILDNYEDGQIIDLNEDVMYGLLCNDKKLQLYKCDQNGKVLSDDQFEIDTFAHLEGGAEILKEGKRQYLENKKIYLKSVRQNNQSFFEDLDSDNDDNTVDDVNAKLNSNLTGDVVTDDSTISNDNDDNTVDDVNAKLNSNLTGDVVTDDSTISNEETIGDSSNSSSSSSNNLNFAPKVNQKSKKLRKNDHKGKRKNNDEVITTKNKAKKRKQADKTCSAKIQFETAQTSLREIKDCEAQNFVATDVELNDIEFAAILRENEEGFDSCSALFGYRDSTRSGKVVILSEHTSLEQLKTNKDGKVTVQLMSSDNAKLHLLSIMNTFSIREFGTTEKMTHIRFILDSLDMSFEWLRSLTTQKLGKLFSEFSNAFYPLWLIRISIFDSIFNDLLKKVMRKLKTNGLTIARKLPSLYPNHRDKIIEIFNTFDNSVDQKCGDITKELNKLQTNDSIILNRKGFPLDVVKTFLDTVKEEENITAFCRSVEKISDCETLDYLKGQFDKFKECGFGIVFAENIEPSECAFMNGDDVTASSKWLSSHFDLQLLFITNDESDIPSLKRTVYLTTPLINGSDTVKLMPISIRLYKNGIILSDVEMVQSIILEEANISTDNFELSDFKQVIKKLGRLSILNDCELGTYILRKYETGAAHSSNKLYKFNKNFII
ncbi:unnamed protein product [Caenorhabditis angaria]|uniref:Uncharacterized protein n=1 Tax=Caenorhabditis angaria TaxID=860376 RepID=A0A9P1IWB0_9PELO|nr:unnamed protein product [Caenorhabditis angaria]